MKNIISNCKLVLILVFLWTGSELGLHFCRKNIFYSGTQSAQAAITGPFECHIKFNSAVSPEKPVLEFVDKDKQTVLQLKIRTALENGTKKFFSDIIYPGGVLTGCSVVPGAADNPLGRLELKIFSNAGKLSAKSREYCDLYIGSFYQFRTVPVWLPDISEVKISQAHSVSAEICRPGYWKKINALFLILRTLSCSLTIIALLSFLSFKMQKKFIQETVPSGIPAGIFSAVIIFGTVGVLWSFLDLKTPQAVLPEDFTRIDSLYPEPEEQLLYLLTLVLSVIVLMVINFFLSGKKFSAFWKFFAGISALAVIFSCRKSEGFLSSSVSFLPGYMFVLLTGLAAFYLVLKRGKFQKLWFIPCIAGAFYLFAFCKIYLLRNLDYFDAHHYCVVLHPLWMTQSGFSPFELSSTYGAYAAFAAPFFAVAGLSSLSADCFFLGLIFICGILLYGTTQKIIKTLFWRCFALAGIAGLFVWNGSPAFYPQYLPLRVIFPSLLFFWTALNMKDLLSVRNCITGTIIAAAAVFWNPDSGCILLASWCIFITVMCLLKPERKNFFRIFLLPITGVVFTGILFGIHFLFYGKFPEIIRLFTMPFLFGKAGFLQLPMPWCGLWLIPAGIYFAALSYFTGAVVAKRVSEKDKLLFFITITGCGLLGYYIGRSYEGNLFSVSYPAIILVASAAGRLRSDSWRIMRFAAVFLLFFVTFNGINSGRKLFQISADQKMFQIYFNKICGYVRKQLPENKNLLYSGYLEALIAIETGAKAPFAHPALEEMFRKNDSRDYIKNLNTSRSPVLWMINMNWVHSRYAPEFMRKILKEQIEKRLKRAAPPNAMLMFYL